MIHEKVEIEVYGRKLNVEIEGLTQLEIHSLAQELTERMEKISRESEIIDSSKLAILTALQILAENARIRTQHDVHRNTQERSMDQMILLLENALASHR